MEQRTENREQRTVSMSIVGRLERLTMSLRESDNPETRGWWHVTLDEAPWGNRKPLVPTHAYGDASGGADGIDNDAFWGGLIHCQ